MLKSSFRLYIPFSSGEVRNYIIVFHSFLCRFRFVKKFKCLCGLAYAHVPRVSSKLSVMGTVPLNCGESLINTAGLKIRIRKAKDVVVSEAQD